MTTGEDYCAVEACVDCLVLLANGEEPGDWPEDGPSLGDLIAARWAGFHLAMGCVETCCERNADGEAPDAWFTWRACEVCGRNLGGNREHVTPFKI